MYICRQLPMRIGNYFCTLFLFFFDLFRNEEILFRKSDFLWRMSTKIIADAHGQLSTDIQAPLPVRLTILAVGGLNMPRLDTNLSLGFLCQNRSPQLLSTGQQAHSVLTNHQHWNCQHFKLLIVHQQLTCHDKFTCCTQTWKAYKQNKSFKFKSEWGSPNRTKKMHPPPTHHSFIASKLAKANSNHSCHSQPYQ